MTVISRDSALPLYHQLREFLKEKIESGEWAPGHQLPGESDLQIEFGVSRATVRQAMQLLENDGLVEKLQGRGTFVGRPKVASNLLSMFTAEGLVRDPGSVSGFHLLHLIRVAPPAYVRTALRLEENDDVYEIRRTIDVNDEHLMLITSWLPHSKLPYFEEKPLAETSLRQVLRNAYSLEIVRQHKEVQATILDDEEAAVLGGHPGAPAMLLTYVNFLRDGTPIEYRKMVVRGDRCKYFIDLDTPELIL